MIDGVDTLYTSTSAQADGIHKYSKVFNGTDYTWVSNGFAARIGIEAMTATVTGSNVTAYATDSTDIYSWTDSSGYNVPISGNVDTSDLHRRRQPIVPRSRIRAVRHHGVPRRL